MLVLAAALALVLQEPEIDEIYAELRKVDRVNPVVLVAQAVTPAVVYIQTEVMQIVNTWGGQRMMFPSSGAGSGVVVRPEGFIVTNYHVVRGANRIQVSFADDPEPWPAEVVSFVEKEDLALLKVQARSRSEPLTSSIPPQAATLTASRRNSHLQQPDFPTPRLGTSSDLMPGEQVVAIGNPHGQSYTVSTGIISGLHRDIPITKELFFSDLIQTDASINFGNSGGPLLNIRGELIGINTAMNTQAENIGFAIPIDRVVEVLNDYLFPQAGSSWLGFEVAGDDGARVSRVWPAGPAEEAGLCEGDRVLSIGGREIKKADDWLLATVEIPAGEMVEVSYQRGGRRGNASVRTWDKLDGQSFEKLGLTVRQVVFSSSRWLLVDKVAEGGPAALTGLASGDLIAALEPLGERPEVVRDKRGLSQLLQRLEPAKPIEIEIYRDDNRDRNYGSEERYTGRIVAR